MKKGRWKIVRFGETYGKGGCVTRKETVLAIATNELDAKIVLKALTVFHSHRLDQWFIEGPDGNRLEYKHVEEWLKAVLVPPAAEKAVRA